MVPQNSSPCCCYVAKLRKMAKSLLILHHYIIIIIIIIINNIIHSSQLYFYAGLNNMKQSGADSPTEEKRQKYKTVWSRPESHGTHSLALKHQSVSRRTAGQNIQRTTARYISASVPTTVDKTTDYCVLTGTTADSCLGVKKNKIKKWSSRSEHKGLPTYVVRP